MACSLLPNFGRSIPKASRGFPNHGKVFKLFLHAFMSDWEERERELRGYTAVKSDWCQFSIPRARGARFTSRSTNEHFAPDEQRSVVLERGAAVVEVTTTVTLRWLIEVKVWIPKNLLFDPSTFTGCLSSIT